jgi:Gpi18-like mannosyltransferase
MLKLIRGVAAVKLNFNKKELSIVATLLLVAFVVRFVFFSNPGYQVDTGDFSSWFSTAADVGVRPFYTVVSWCDYPPLNVYFFWLFGSLAKGVSAFGTNLFLYIMKLPANIFDLATAFLIFAFIRERSSFKWALLAAGLYAFNPAVIFNAAVWGQFDAIYTFFLVLSIFLLFESTPKWTFVAVVAFMLGILTKPQSIALAPLFIYLALRRLNWNWKSTLAGIAVAVATVFAVILPFEWSNPVTFLSSKYFGAYGTYPYTTLNAFNVWGFGGMWVLDKETSLFVTPYVLGWVLFAALAAFTVYFVHKRWRNNDASIVLFAALVLFFGFFMLPTRIHERYLFPAMAMLVLLFPLVKKARPLYVVLTATCFVNQAYVLDALVAAYPYGANLTGDSVVFIVSLINSLTLVYVLILMVGELAGKHWLTPKPKLESVPQFQGEATYDAVEQT